MPDNYTYLANDRCFDLVDTDLASIWNTIENTPEDTGADKWNVTLTRMASEFAFSSRFALMRILCAWANGISLNHLERPDSFSLDINGTTCRFENITIEHAETLDKEEIVLYEAAFAQIAARRKLADEAKCRYLIAKAFRDEAEAYSAAKGLSPHDRLPAKIPAPKAESRIRKECKTLLSRQEAMSLGHILGFSLQEMSWFLLRVFDFEDGFRYNFSEDLIEAYGFLTDSGLDTIDRIKKEYAVRSAAIPKAAAYDRDEDWTRSTGASLPNMVDRWSALTDRESCFLAWLQEKSPFLDLPSRSATSIYRRIAAYAYSLSTGENTAGDSQAFMDELERLCSDNFEYDLTVQDLLFEDKKISVKKCAKASAVLLEKNKELYTSAPDRAKAWRTITATESGLPRLIMAGRPDAGRDRVQLLLSGEYQVEKGDMLHMLWFAFSFLWLEHPIFGPHALFNSLADFTEAAEKILGESLLPPFYPPHIMEQSMMLSIVASSVETGVPADVYAEICESLIKPRSRTSKNVHGIKR